MRSLLAWGVFPHYFWDGDPYAGSSGSQMPCSNLRDRWWTSVPRARSPSPTLQSPPDPGALALFLGTTPREKPLSALRMKAYLSLSLGDLQSLGGCYRPRNQAKLCNSAQLNFLDNFESNLLLL